MVRIGSNILWRDLALLCRRPVFDLESSEGNSCHWVGNSLPHHESDAKARKTPLLELLLMIVILDIVFSLDSVITAVGLTENRWVIIVAVHAFNFAVILFFCEADWRLSF